MFKNPAMSMAAAAAAVASLFKSEPYSAQAAMPYQFIERRHKFTGGRKIQRAAQKRRNVMKRAGKR